MQTCFYSVRLQFLVNNGKKITFMFSNMCINKIYGKQLKNEWTDRFLANS